MKTYPIIHIEFPNKSFSWANGLYAVIETKGKELNLCKIKEKGEPETFDDGKLMISCTGIDNKGITPTKLSITI